MTFVEPQENETWVSFWKRQNRKDKAIELCCQSCCYRYLDKCLFRDTLHPYDRSAETCPDYIPKDLYKGKSRSKCLNKRLSIEPNNNPLPDCELWHPLYRPFVLCSAWEYYSIITKEKAYRIVEKIRDKKK